MIKVRTGVNVGFYSISAKKLKVCIQTPLAKTAEHDRKAFFGAK